MFYVGVSRYLRRRWLGGDQISYQESHSSKWDQLYVLSAHAHGVRQVEGALIKFLRQEFGERCANLKGGGGGTSPYKACMLYIFV